MIDWDLVASLIATVIVVGLLVFLAFLIYRGAQIGVGCALSLFGIVFAFALWYDALNGWPILRRVAWLVLQLVMGVYSGLDSATSGIPALPNWFE